MEYKALLDDLDNAAESMRATQPLNAVLLERAASAIRELTEVTRVSGPRVPYAAILGQYNAVLGRILPQVKQLTPHRRSVILSRWNDSPDNQSVEFWTKFFQKVAASDFLSGRRSPGKGHENWRPSLDWIIKSENFIKILEGNYDNRASAGDVRSVVNFR